MAIKDYDSFVTIAYCECSMLEIEIPWPFVEAFAWPAHFEAIGWSVESA
jgi:hypothetical protein